MVKAGYIQPDEALYREKEDILTEEATTTEFGMQRATNIFFDHVVNVRQDLLSPQYDQFYDASVPTSN